MVKIDLEDMTDVCGGPMTLKDLHREIHHYMYTKKPEKMVITIERDELYELAVFQKHYSVIYIPNKDFEKKSKW